MTRVECPLCQDHPLEVETASGRHLGFLTTPPEGDVEGAYFPGLTRGTVVFCEPCGEVSASEVLDHLYR